MNPLKLSGKKKHHLSLSKANNRHQKRARWALDSQQVARVCGGRYALGG
jgi:hypothetical protein